MTTFAPVPCHRCGEDFPPASTNGTDKFCTVCRPIVRKEQAARAQRERRRRANPPPELGDLLYRHPLGPEEHKLARRALGLDKVDDLLALSPGNDPFYQGGDTHERDAGWFKSLWDGAGALRAHLRRIHYWALSAVTLRANGETPHENTDAAWTLLTRSAMRARVLGLIDPETVEDRRNDPAVVNCPARDSEPEPYASLEDGWDGGLTLPHIWVPTGLSLEFPQAYAYGYDYERAEQAALVELWVEKSTMNDILEPLCRSLGINLVTGSGHQSITSAIALLRRAEAHGRAAHVLYLADFDPGGDSMARSVARQAQFWAQHLGIDADMSVEIIGLTAEQVKEYGLPTIPIKETDRRRAAFEARHGVDGAVELDALEALRPGELARLVREAVEPWMDESLSGLLEEAEGEADALAAEAWEASTADLRDELEAIKAEAGPILDRHRQVVARLNAELAPLRDRLASLAGQARARFDETGFDLPERPEPEEPDVDRDSFLFDSRRTWLEQLPYWQRAKDGNEP
jgi:hypothetical protein